MRGPVEPDNSAPVVNNLTLSPGSELANLTANEMLEAFKSSSDSQPVKTLLQLLKQEFETSHNVERVSFLNVKMALVPNNPSSLTLEYQLQ